MIMVDRNIFIRWLNDMANEASDVGYEEDSDKDRHFSEAILRIADALKTGRWDLNPESVMFRYLRNAIVQYCEEHVDETGRPISELQYDLMATVAKESLELQDALRDIVSLGIEKHIEDGQLK